MSAAREIEIADFLVRCGWTARSAMRFQAMLRSAGTSVWRVLRGRAILMDAPPPEEDVRPFVRVAHLLKAAGLASPEILAMDADGGFLLLEDLGDDLFSRVLGQGADETTLYLAAVEALAVLHGHPVPGDLPRYCDDLFLFEVSLLADWFMPLAGLELTRAGRDELFSLWRDLLPLARGVPECVVLRDYHADNLVWLPERDGIRRVGQLDFQDAVAGPATYDIVSLLDDVRRDVAPATTEAAVEHYLHLKPHVDREAFETSAAILGVQRNLKIAGIFCRLFSRDGKADYQEFMPRTWRLVGAGLNHHALVPFAAWIDRWIPERARTRAA